MLTAVPWRGAVLVGTFQSDDAVPPDSAPAPAQMIDRFLVEIQSAFPQLGATRDAIRFMHHALVPAQRSSKGYELLAEPQVLTHAESPGLFSLVGVKYTTARLAAERAVDAVARHLGMAGRPSRTATTLLPHADVADSDGMLEELARSLRITLDRDVQAHLAAWYGTEATAVLRSAHAAGALGRLCPTSPVIAGEVIHAVREAMAVRLDDVVFRRTPLGSAGNPGDEAIHAVADVMARECGWDTTRRDDEIAVVRQRFIAP